MAGWIYPFTRCERSPLINCILGSRSCTPPDYKLIGLQRRHSSISCRSGLEEVFMDQDKSKNELIDEIVDLREQITILKLSEIQRKKAEDALRLSEELNRAILSSLVEDIAVL